MSGTRVWAMRGVLLAMTALAYVPVWNNDFIDYDDEPFITKNPHLMKALTPAGIQWAWTCQEPPYWMPVTNISFLFDAFLSSKSQVSNELSPVVFHGQNLFWHICNAQLLFALLLHLTAKPWHCFLVAALFAVHPMHVESVAWAIERKDVLMCFFGLLSLWAYIWYVEKRSWMAYLVMLLAYQASLMSKPMLITLPFVLILLDYWPLCRFQFRATQPDPVFEMGKRQVPFGWLFLEKLPVFVVALLMAGQTMVTRSGDSMPDLSIVGRAMNGLAGYECYLYKTFYPVGLAVFYPHPGNNWSVLHCLVGAGLLLCCTAISLWWAKRCRWLPVGWFWFAGTLVPVIGLVQGGHQGWADRFSYWPHIGLFIVVVWGTAELANWLHIPDLVLGSMWAMVLGSLMVLTWLQVGYWRTSIVLWEHAVAVTEDNSFAHEHLSMNYRREGRLEEAEYHNIQAAQIQRVKRRQSLSR